MDKYCIIPESGMNFWELAKGALVSEVEREQLRRAVVRHVEISPAEGTWEVLVKTQMKLSEDLLMRIGEKIALHCELSDVIFYQEVEDWDAAITEAWSFLVARVSAGNVAVKNLLLGASHYVDEDYFCVEVKGELSLEMLRAHHIPQALKEDIHQMFGWPCEVKCLVKAEEMVFAPEHGHILYPPTRSVAKEKESKAIVQRVEARAPKTTNANRIYGKAIIGEAQSIGDIEGEMKEVIITGGVTSPRVQTFKTGTTMVAFSIADDTNGMSCKLFFTERKGKKNEEFEREKEQVLALFGNEKKLSGVEFKMKGSVQIDRFNVGEYIFVPKAITRLEKVERVDNAPVKRTELHLHTTMSNMDGVTHVGKLVEQAAKWGWDSIAVTDHGVVQAFPDAASAAKKHGIKVIYGMEGYLVEEDHEQKRANHIIFLAKSHAGLLNLYRMISFSHLRFLHRQPRLPRYIINTYREGLILGSACEAGELIRAIVAQQSDEELLKIADFYDYLEIQPIGNNEFLKRSDNFPDIQTDDDLREINRKVIELGKKLNKPVVATCDVHFLNPEDSIYRAILMKGKGFEDADCQPPLYLRTTEEMLAEFDYLDEDLAYEVVVTNPRKIADRIQQFKPIPDALYSPKMQGAEKEIREKSYQKAKEWYGENLPKLVVDRLEEELQPIIRHGFSSLYLIAQRLVKKSNDDGYLVGSRGSVGSSFIATMIGITEVNPLPPHWRCPHCKYNKFVTDGSVGCGYDLEDKVCPVCGTPLIKDGHEIPFAVFLGFDGDKVPDIDLNFSGTYQPVAHKYTEVLFGRDFVYRAGSIATVADKTAYGYVKKYFEEKGLVKHRAYIERMAKGCMGVKRTTGQHPAGIMVVPRDMDIHLFSPIQHPADDKTSNIVTTHFDYHSISSRLVKLDILGHDDPTVIRMLEELTHRDAKTIPFDDPATLSLFNSTDVFNLTPEELGANSGTFGIPEFRTNFTREMIDATNPSCFADLVRISGFSHGTDVWLGNAYELIKAGICTLKDAISARDDIMMYLIHAGIDPLLSFKTMEKVRKGKGIDPDVVEKLRAGGIPEWYIEACQKIKYLFPRAHATAYVMMAYRIAFCKVHYPLAFYAAYFSIRADEFDANIISRGQEEVEKLLTVLEGKVKDKTIDDKEKAMLIVLQLARELYLRGYGVEYVDLYKSDADKFIVLENTLLPPFAALSGVGATAARNIVEARKDGHFTSIEDLRKRAGISKTVIEVLRTHGVLAGMGESDQIELFAI